MKPSTTQRARAAFSSALSGLRMYWRGALLATIAAAVALSAAAPIWALTSGLDVGSASLGLDQTWSPAATAAVVFQRLALRALFAPLLGAAGGVLALAGVTILVGAAARAGQRAGEIAVRRAVGASRRALSAMAAIEAALLAGATLLASGGLAAAAYQLARLSWPGVSSGPSITALAATVVAFVGAFGIGALFILVPARQRTVRVSAGPPLELYLAGALLSLGLMVVTSSALLSRHVSMLTNGTSRRDDGSLYRVESGIGTTAQRSAAFAGLLTELGITPGVEVASIASPGVAVGLGEVGGVTTDCGDCSEANMRLPFHITSAVRHLVSADTFRAIGARVIEGRGISAADVAGSARVVVVNRALALRHFQYGKPVGRRLQLDGVDGWYTVVGVVDEPEAIGLGASMLPRYAVYLSVLQHPAARVEVLVRSRNGQNAGKVTNLIDRALRPSAGMPAAVTEAAWRAAQLAPLVWVSRWLGVEGWAGWIVATLGTLMLLRLWLGALTPELGLRRAVGAPRRAILATVLLRATGAGLGGVGVALWFGPGVWRAFGNVIAGLPGWDPLLIVKYGSLLALIALAAALPGALRAVRAAPARLVDVVDG